MALENSNLLLRSIPNAEFSSYFDTFTGGYAIAAVKSQVLIENSNIALIPSDISSIAISLTVESSLTIRNSSIASQLTTGIVAQLASIFIESSTVTHLAIVNSYSVPLLATDSTVGFVYLDLTDATIRLTRSSFVSESSSGTQPDSSISASTLSLQQGSTIISGQSITVIDSQIADSTTSNITIAGTGTLSLVSTDISNNTVHSNISFFIVMGSQPRISFKDCNVFNNEGPLIGPDVLTSNSRYSTSFANTRIYNNKKCHMQFGAYTSLSNVTFRSNTSPQQYSLIQTRISTATILLDNCTFVNNTTPTGAAILSRKSGVEIIIDSSQFVNHTGRYILSVGSTVLLKVTSSNFTHNKGTVLPSYP